MLFKEIDVMVSPNDRIRTDELVSRLNQVKHQKCNQNRKLNDIDAWISR